MTSQDNSLDTSIVGDVVFGNRDSPVAVCTLATRRLLADLAGRDEIAVAGRCQTENIGVERMVQNIVAMPSLRYVIVCGQETSHAVGQTILSLHRHGLDADGRVIGSVAPDPHLPNLSPEQLRQFQARVSVVDMIGERDPAAIVARAALTRDAEPAPASRSAGVDATGERPSRRSDPARHPVRAPSSHPTDPSRSAEHVVAEPDPSDAWAHDPLGYFLILLDRPRKRILVEHHARDHRLLRTLEGTTALALGQTIARRALASLPAHLVYLGRELQKAELALRHDLHYEQDVPLDPRRPGAASAHDPRHLRAP